MTKRPYPEAAAAKPDTPETETRLDYEVVEAGWVAGKRRAKGETVSLTPRAARYERVERAATKRARKDAGESK